MCGVHLLLVVLSVQVREQLLELAQLDFIARLLEFDLGCHAGPKVLELQLCTGIADELDRGRQQVVFKQVEQGREGLFKGEIARCAENNDGCVLCHDWFYARRDDEWVWGGGRRCRGLRILAGSCGCSSQPRQEQKQSKRGPNNGNVRKPNCRARTREGGREMRRDWREGGDWRVTESETGHFGTFSRAEPDIGEGSNGTPRKLRQLAPPQH